MKKFNKKSALRKIKINQNKNTYIKRLSISLSCLILIIVIMLFAFAKFEASSDVYTLINGRINYSTCEYTAGQVIYAKSSTGKEEIVTIPEGCPGAYKLEVWGAQGGGKQNNSSADSSDGGKGGYSIGTVKLNGNTKLYVYAGKMGQTSTSGKANGGFNGGGSAWASSSSEPGNGGGGASDIRIGDNSLYSRVIVAGGGGGAGEDSSDTPGYGGGTSGGTSSGHSTAATQTSTGTGGQFGQGAHTAYDGGAGGGGWYGGGTLGGQTSAATSNSSSDTSGGCGGSGYVYTSSTASNYPSGCKLNSSYYLTDASTTAGNTSFKSPTGTNETGHSGDGYVKITFISEVVKKKVTVNFNANGGSVSSNNKVVYLNDAYGSLPLPQYSNHYFLGWFTDPTNGDRIDDTTIVSNNSTHTLYAHWLNATSIYLYNSGNEYSNITGGWYGQASGAGGQIAKNSDNLYVYGKVVTHGTQGGGGYYKTNNYIDLTNFNSLTITYGYYFSYYTWGDIHASPKKIDDETTLPTLTIFKKSPNTTEISNDGKTETLDISSYTGLYYFRFNCSASATSGNYSWIKLYSIKLE